MARRGGDSGGAVNILVTTDGSRRSLDALDHAAVLARVVGADLVLGHVLDPDMARPAEAGDDPSTTIEALGEDWRDDLSRRLAAAGLRGRAAVELKRPGEEVYASLLRLARQQRVQLVAMATRGSGAIRHALLGSVAMGLLAHTPLPVMVTGGEIKMPHASALYHILVTTDGSSCAEPALFAARHFFRRANRDMLRMTILRVYAPAFADSPDPIALEECRKQLATFRRHAPRRHPVELLLREAIGFEKVEAAIVDVAREIGANAIWMSTHGHSARRHLLMGSTALGVVSRAETPVALVRAFP